MENLDFAGLAAALVLLVAAGEAIRRILAVLHRISLQAEAFLGAPAAGAIPARPGLIERVERLEDAMAQVAEIQAEMAKLQGQMTQVLAKE